MGRKNKPARTRGLSTGERAFVNSVDMGEYPREFVEELIEYVQTWPDEKKESPIEVLRLTIQIWQEKLEELDGEIDNLEQHYKSGMYPPPPATEEDD